MKYWRIMALLIFTGSRLALSGQEPLPDAAETPPSGEAAPAVFPLIPLLEAAFGGSLRWRPDWPPDIPPDAFALSGEKPESPPKPLSLVLSNGTETFSLKRNSAGRLTEFPWFTPDARLRVTAGYDASGAIQSLSLSAAGAAGQTWKCAFPPGFFPYGPGSTGGIFPPVRVSQNAAAFVVVFAESPDSLSETWYDEAGNPLVRCEAPVSAENGSWRVRSLQIRDQSGPRSEVYAFDNGGNITEVTSPAGRFSALYRDNRPRYWERQPVSGPAGAEDSPWTDFYRSALGWDERGLLMALSFEDPFPAESPADAGEAVPSALPSASPPEFRYEYERNAAGNWTKRRDTAVTGQFGVPISRSGGVWTRQIYFTKD
jgi:hypothetical protein